MKHASIGLAVVALAVVLALPYTANAQAFSVGTDGTMGEEKAPEAIPPEQQATPEQLAQLFQAMRIHAQMDQMRRMVMTSVETGMRQQIDAVVPARSHLTAEQRQQVEVLVESYVSKTIDLYPVDEMLNDLTTLYQRYLTRDDVAAMTAFYSSPAGQHLLEAQPHIAKDYLPIVMRRSQERSRPLVTDLIREMTALESSWHVHVTPAAKK